MERQQLDLCRQATQHKFFFGLPLIAMLLLSACYTTYQVESKSKLPGKGAQLNIYRKGLVGFLRPTSIDANNAFVGKVGPNRYLSFWVPEGEYLLEFRNYRMFDAYTFYKVVVAEGTSMSLQITPSFFDSYRPKIIPVTDTSFINKRRKPGLNFHTNR